MKTLIAMLMLLLVIAILLLPVALMMWGVMPSLPLWLRITLIITGVAVAWLVKPLSILLDRDLKII